MTPADIAALRGLCERATPGPWKPNVWIETDGDEWRATGPGHDRHAHDYGSEPGGPDEQAAQADAAFIAAARSALPALIDEAERLTKILDDRMCMKCGGQGEWCVDRCYGNEHYQEMEQCAECNGDGRTEDLTVAHTLEMAAQQLRANAWKETR